ncbi:MAG: hypothetical protein QM728_13530 [Gordonia sp. (in: high G+C Gram-positive bacteria)]|uniref:hypothetical protein n=1 Tax=Gordonia sp. (in: high G+C Gram-positive bacteria) TaxID=84139 RepID=UPI0039E3FD54
MLKTAKIAAALFAGSVTLGLVAPAAQADVSVRDGKTADLYVRAEKPNNGQLERQFAAFWNPRVPTNPKVAVSYGGEKARPALNQVMGMSKTYDYFSIQGRAAGPITINGNRMSVVVHGVMAGFPAQTLRYHWLRDANLWKFDWKRTCAEIKCQGNPNFGY